MGMGVKVRVWGDYALFSRPEMKVERCSYDVITPSAARGILEAIYWHPGMKWFPTRERGLKWKRSNVWDACYRRSPRGKVD